MIISQGYFLYDLIAMIYLGICDRQMFLHHMLCISALTTGLLTCKDGGTLVSSLLLTEISNPAMHFRVILKHLGKRYTKAYETAELTYIAFYMFGRIGLGLPVLYRVWVCTTNHIIVKLMGLGIFL
jgi:hypothetical protein